MTPPHHEVKIKCPASCARCGQACVGGTQCDWHLAGVAAAAAPQMRTFSDPSVPKKRMAISELAKMWWGVLTAVLASACATDLAHVASSQQAGHVVLDARGSTSCRVPATREGGDTVHHDEQQTRVDLSARRNTHASRVHPMSVALPAAVGMPRAPRTSASLKWSTATLPP
jgi:hypothetical protein